MLASVAWCLCTANLADGDFENVLRRIFSINLTITTVFVMRINCKQEPSNAQSRRAKSPAFDQRAAPKKTTATQSPAFGRRFIETAAPYSASSLTIRMSRGGPPTGLPIRGYHYGTTGKAQSPQIKHHFLLWKQVVTTRHLGQTGKARGHHGAIMPAMDTLLELGAERRAFRTRSDK